MEIEISGILFSNILNHMALNTWAEKKKMTMSGYRKVELWDFPSSPVGHEMEIIKGHQKSFMVLNMIYSRLDCSDWFQSVYMLNDTRLIKLGSLSLCRLSMSTIPQ